MSRTRARQHERPRDAQQDDDEDNQDGSEEREDRTPTTQTEDAFGAPSPEPPREPPPDWNVVRRGQEVLNRADWVTIEEARALLATRLGAEPSSVSLAHACLRYRLRHEGRRTLYEPWGTLPPDDDWQPQPTELACIVLYHSAAALVRSQAGRRVRIASYRIYRPSLARFQLHTAPKPGQPTQGSGRGRRLGTRFPRTKGEQSGQGGSQKGDKP